MMHRNFLLLRHLVFSLVAVGFICAAAPLQADGSLDKARQYIQAGDRKAAIIELKNLLQKDPGDVAGRLLLGQVYLETRAGAESEKEFLRAAELGAPPAAWRLQLVDALLAQGKYSDALDRLEAVGELEDAKAESAVLARTGAAQFGLKQTDDARSAYERASKLDPDNEMAAMGKVRLALSDGDLDAAASAADAFLERFPNNLDILLIRAELHRTSSELEPARALFERALEQRPGEIRARLGHATVLIALRDYDAAKADLDRADEIRGAVPMTSYLRGLVAFQEKDWEASKQHLERVLTFTAGHLQSELLLGIISFSNNDLQLAEEYLSRVVSTLPTNAQAVKILAATRIKLRKPKKAIEVLEPLVSENPDAQSMALLGSAYMLGGDQETGQRWLSEAVEKSPDVAALRTQLALTLLAGGETAKAIDELQSAVDLGQDVLQADVLLVLAHLKNKQFEKALEAGRALEQRSPDQAVPFNLTGLAYLAQGDLEKASERFGKALSVDPEFVTAELNLARVDVAQDDLASAQKRYEGILVKQPSNLTAMLGLSALAERRGDAEALVVWLEKAQDANPKAIQPGLALGQFYIQRKDGLKALSVASDLSIRFQGNSKVLELLAKAQLLAGETSNAARTLEQLSRLRPGDQKLSFLLGGAKWKAGDLYGARAEFEKIIAKTPGFIPARVALTSVLMQEGNVGDALKEAKRLQADSPDLSVGYQLEGRIYLKKKRPDTAIEPLAIAFEKQGDSEGVMLLAQAYVGDDQRLKAIEVLDKWVSDHPEDIRAWALLAQSKQLEGRNQEAVEAYEKVVEAGSKSYIVLNNLAWLYHILGDERAVEVARQAYDLQPNRPEVADTYGWVLVNSGEAEQGLSILQQAYVLYPTHTEIGFHVAVALKAVGRNDEAVKLLRRLLRDTPGFEQAPEAKALLVELEK